jgi:hypothetical protein
MTTIDVPGRITALEVDESGDFGITALTGGSPQASATTVSPSGERHTIITTAGSGNVNTNFYFKLDSSFNIGDVVEIYVTTPGNSFGVLDENGVDIIHAGAVVLRKIATGSTSPTWGFVA